MKKKVMITQTAKGNVQVISIKGFMDMTEVKKLESVLDRLITEGKTQIVLDLSGLEYISSAGLGAIIGRIHETRKSGGDIKVGGCFSRVYDILKVFGFTDVFDVFEDVSDAVKQFKE